MLTVAVCETAPDRAVTTIEAVPRLGCMPLPYPPQPPSVSASAIIVNAAVAVSSEARAVRTFPALHRGRLNKIKAARKARRPIGSGIKSPYRRTLAEVVTVSLVLAAPLAGVTVGGLK